MFGILKGLVLVPILLGVTAVFAIFKLLLWPFPRKGLVLTQRDVAAYIRNELYDLRDDKYRWDDFEQIKLHDPDLELIRQQAVSVRFPLDRADREKLESLLTGLKSAADNN